jgi:uncharacterized protein YceK
MRILVVAIALCLLTGCADPVTVQNPRTSETVTCGSQSWELNPWSQHDACVADHLAQGWVIVR